MDAVAVEQGRTARGGQVGDAARVLANENFGKLAHRDQAFSARRGGVEFAQAAQADIGVDMDEDPGFAPIDLDSDNVYVGNFHYSIYGN